MLLKWKASARTWEGIYNISKSMILCRKIVLKVVLNRIVNPPDTGYLPDTRFPDGYPVDIRYSPSTYGQHFLVDTRCNFILLSSSGFINMFMMKYDNSENNHCSNHTWFPGQVGWFKFNALKFIISQIFFIDLISIYVIMYTKVFSNNCASLNWTSCRSQRKCYVD